MDNKLLLRILNALDVTIQAFSKGLSLERSEQLHQSTMATLAELSKYFGKPTSNNIAQANRELKRIEIMMEDDTPFSQKEKIILVQLYAMKARVLDSKVPSYPCQDDRQAC